MKKVSVLKVLMALMVVFALSCDNNNDDNSSVDNETTSTQDKQYEEMLEGTTWIRDYFITDGVVTQKINAPSEKITYTQNHIVYFLNLSFFNNNNKKITAKWKVKNGEIWYYDHAGGAEERNNLVGLGYISKGTIEYLTSSEMKLATYTDGQFLVLKKVAYDEGDSSDEGNNGGGGSDGEAPYVTSFTFTATKTSITVKFMCNEKPTSATVKYGTSSATKTISSSISGKQVSATASGLKAGTKYYFKCTVKNSNGSSTSDEYPAITNY